MALYLNVPYTQKDEAKALGARWDPTRKKWYVVKRKDYVKFQKWIGGNLIVCDHIYIVEGRHTCFQCEKETVVIGFGFDYCFDLHDPNCEPYSKSVSIDMVQSQLPEPLEKKLQEQYGFRRKPSKKPQNNCYANYCQNCGVIQGNYDLFDEVESPFFIDGKEAAEKLVLHRIKLEHDVAISASMSYGSEDYLIKEHARIIDSDLRWETGGDSVVTPTYQRPAIGFDAFDAPVTPVNSAAQLEHASKQKGTSAFSWGNTLLLAILLGLLGVHRLYVGKVGTGVLYIFTFGLFGIGWLVDIIMIMCGKFCDCHGCLIKRKKN